mmetsp:Transcript_23033/g.78466  ORF Transcript_23033/g.78466 Transcript_23033/m.78466 type:complete len:868 (-) Transcript_23033:3378-5981(-)
MSTTHFSSNTPVFQNTHSTTSFGSRNVRWQVTLESEGSGQLSRFQSICASAGYKAKSVEEVRFEDYACVVKDETGAYTFLSVANQQVPSAHDGGRASGLPNSVLGTTYTQGYMNTTLQLGNTERTYQPSNQSMLPVLGSHTSPGTSSLTTLASPTTDYLSQMNMSVKSEQVQHPASYTAAADHLTKPLQALTSPSKPDATSLTFPPGIMSSNSSGPVCCAAYHASTAVTTSTPAHHSVTQPFWSSSSADSRTHSTAASPPLARPSVTSSGFTGVPTTQEEQPSLVPGAHGGVTLPLSFGVCNKSHAVQQAEGRGFHAHLLTPNAFTAYQGDKDQHENAEERQLVHAGAPLSVTSNAWLPHMYGLSHSNPVNFPSALLYDNGYTLSTDKRPVDQYSKLSTLPFPNTGSRNALAKASSPYGNLPTELDKTNINVSCIHAPRSNLQSSVLPSEHEFKRLAPISWRVKTSPRVILPRQSTRSNSAKPDFSTTKKRTQDLKYYTSEAIYLNKRALRSFPSPRQLIVENQYFPLVEHSSESRQHHPEEYERVNSVRTAITQSKNCEQDIQGANSMKVPIQHPTDLDLNSKQVYTQEVLVHTLTMGDSHGHTTVTEAWRAVQPTLCATHLVPAPLLNKPGYYTIPSCEKLAQLANASQLHAVPNFTVGCTDYGQVRWLSPTDIRGINLDHIIKFEKNAVHVYPEASNKPKRGHGLNKPAEITLYNVFKTDRRTGEKETRDSIVAKFAQRLAQKEGTKFISYESNSGTWIFQVQHFSRWGIDNADLDHTKETALGLCQSRIPPTASQKTIPSISDRPTQSAGWCGVQFSETDRQLPYSNFSNSQFVHMEQLQQSLRRVGTFPDTRFPPDSIWSFV